MAVINKTGITNGGTIQAEHITRAIDALSAGSTDTIIATGSFSGSLTGIATTANTASVVTVTDTTTGTGPYYIAFTDGTTATRNIRVDSAALTFNATTNVLSTTASFATSASFAVSGSRTVSASFATTASFALNASSFPFSGSARITGSLGVTGSFTTTAGTASFGSTTINGFVGGNITGSSTLIMNLSTLGSSGNFILPTTAPSSPTRGSIYWDFGAGRLYIYDGSQWLSTTLTSGG